MKININLINNHLKIVSINNQNIIKKDNQFNFLCKQILKITNSIYSFLGY